MSKKRNKNRRGRKTRNWLIEHRQKENEQIKEWRYKGTPGWARMD